MIVVKLLPLLALVRHFVYLMSTKTIVHKIDTTTLRTDLFSFICLFITPQILIDHPTATTTRQKK